MIKSENPVSDAIEVKAKLRIIKWILRIVGGLIFSWGFLFIVILIIVVAIVVDSNAGFSNTVDYTRFSAAVEGYRPIVQRECSNQGIESYVNVVLAIMQCETAGNTSDPMNSSDKKSNTMYGHTRGDITNTGYSIKCGVSEIKDLIEICNVTDINDSTNLLILYQAYEFDRNYIGYALENGGYSVDNAQDYIDKNDKLGYRNRTFAISVSMYMNLLTSNFKRFIYPLSIYTCLKDYDDSNTCIIMSGVNKQVVLSSCKGTVDSITPEGDNYKIEVSFNEYIIVYHFISDVIVKEGDTVLQGVVIGRVSYIDEYDTYGMGVEIYKDNEVQNPNDYLNVVTIMKQELDPDSINKGKEIASYAEFCIDNLPYKPGGTTAFGCDEAGFIYNLFSNFINYYDEYYDLSISSWEDLINDKNVSYKIVNPEEIVSQVLYEGDVIIYQNASNEYVTAGVYIGNLNVVHMTEYGVVKDQYKFMQPAIVLRFIGQKNLNMLWPLPGYGRDCITSDFTLDRINPVTGVLEIHKGTDIGAPEGTEVIAAADGTIIMAGYGSETGYHVIIDHGNGIKTYYYHASALCSSVGQEVTAGTVIMYVGSTGQSTGNHLHFGLNINDEWVNAMNYSYLSEE